MSINRINALDKNFAWDGYGSAPSGNPDPKNLQLPTSYMGVSENEGYLRVPLKGYYQGTIRVTLKGSIRVLEFPKIRGTLFWGPYSKDPTI